MLHPHDTQELAGTSLEYAGRVIPVQIDPNTFKVATATLFLFLE